MSQDPRSERATQPTRLQRFLGTRLVTGTGMWLSRHVPPFVGYAVAGLIARLINWLKPTVYWTVHGNLRQVMGPETPERELHRLVRQVFRNNARNVYEFWRVVGLGREGVRAAYHIPPHVWACIKHAQQRGKGVIIAGTHTGNFDLGILALAIHEHGVQVLGLAAPPGGGFDLMDELRIRTGVHLTSISVPSLREAVRRLRNGGMVLTGVDRPVGDEEATVEFFGRPALLPTGHVRLALKTDATILVAGLYRDERGENAVRFYPPLEMVRTGDTDEDLRVNLRRVTARLEELIRTWPEQWAVFLPVWPEQDS